MTVQTTLPSLHFAELPEPAFKAARAGILGLGFADQALLRNFRFSTGGDTTATANMLAFADPTQRTPADYAAISVFNHANGETPTRAVEVLSSSGALFHLLHRGHSFDFWTSGFDPASDRPSPRPIFRDAAYDRVGDALSRFAIDLTPNRIVDVKRGRDQFRLPQLADIQPLQLALWTIEVNRRVLAEYFTHAVAVIRHAQTQTSAWSDNETTELSVKLLGLVVLADTGALGEETRLERDALALETLWERGNKAFPRYFLPIPEAALAAARQALSVLAGVSYAGFQPEMLIELYTAAYTKQQRRQLGRYDTPMYLTRRIWEQLPVELLPPEQRVVCDMTAGWGSFLIAGHERLSRLTDMRGRPLREHIHGNDLSPSAALLAQFGLLLSTLQDTWHVDTVDALHWDWMERARPSIIVGNPPFGGDRKTPIEGVTQRVQAADAFLARAVRCLAPEGLLAMVMPRNFVVAEASPDVRRELFESCELLEIWELPVEVFEDASVRPTVVFARKHPAGGALKNRTVSVVRSLQPNTLPVFKDRRVFTRSALLPDPQPAPPKRGRNSAKDYTLDYEVLLSRLEWRELRDRCVRLEERASIFRGCIVGNESRRRTSADSEPRPVPFLEGGKLVMPTPYLVDYSGERTMRYPHDFEEPRERCADVLNSEKVLVGYIVEPKWGQQTRVAIERRGAYVSDHFWVVAANASGHAQNFNNEVLAAIIEWVVGNAWVVEQIRSTHLPKSALRTLPVPRVISAGDRDAITTAVRAIEKAASTGAAVPQTARQTIDQVLRRLYGLSEDLAERLYAIRNWGLQSPITLDHGPNLGADWPVDGIVEAVDPEAGTVTLWLDGFPELQSVAISGHMPAWLLREGMPFRTSVTRNAWSSRTARDARAFGTFSVMPYAYLDEEGVLDRLATTMGEGSR